MFLIERNVFFGQILGAILLALLFQTNKIKNIYIQDSLNPVILGTKFW